MGQHYLRGTVEVSEWCRRCRKNTMHRVDGVKLGACLECIAAREAEAAAAPPPPAEQEELFK